MFKASKTTLYISGAARRKDLIYIIAKDRGLQKDDVNHTRFVAFERRRFCHNGDRNWNATAVCVAKKPAEKMVAVGEDGEVFTYVGGKVVEEAIKPKPAVLRGIGVVDGFPVVCGMKRQVYKRVDENTWVAMHAPAPGSKKNAGFEDIAGFSGDEIYAVGWNGEIWQWDGSSWTERKSPSKFILTGVCCGDDGLMYVCGQNGVLLRGRHDAWEAIGGKEKSDFWDVCWFGGKVYVASLSMIYLLENSCLVPVKFEGDFPQSFGKLTQAEDVLWSVGASDVFSFDGHNWTRID